MRRLWLLSLATTVTFSLPSYNGRPDCSPDSTAPLTDLAGFRILAVAGDTVLLLDSAITEPGRRCTVTVATAGAGGSLLAVAYDRTGNVACPAVIATTASVDPFPGILPKPPPNHRCGGRP